uniref:Uncharacterized protein n=1 Tax=Anguilla anguilla TaxID=7936 RepID=A0A0E9XZM4_ANGAN
MSPGNWITLFQLSGTVKMAKHLSPPMHLWDVPKSTSSTSILRIGPTEASSHAS